MTRGTLTGTALVTTTTNCFEGIQQVDDWARSLGPTLTGVGDDPFVIPGCASSGFQWTYHPFGFNEAYVWIDGRLHVADRYATGPGRGADWTAVIYLPLDPRHLTLQVPIALIPLTAHTPTDLTLGNIEVRNDTSATLKLSRCQGTPSPTGPAIETIEVDIDNFWAIHYFQTVVGGPYDIVVDNSLAQLNVTTPGDVQSDSVAGGVSATLETLTVTIDDTSVTARWNGMTATASWTPTDADPAETYLRLWLELSGGNGGAENPAQGEPDGRNEEQVGNLIVSSDLGNCLTLPTC